MKRIIVTVYCLIMLVAIAACALAYAQGEDRADADKTFEIFDADVEPEDAEDEPQTPTEPYYVSYDEVLAAAAKAAEPYRDRFPHYEYKTLEDLLAYALYDIDGDGTDELIVQTWIGCDGWQFYTMTDSGAVLAGELYAHNSQLFVGEDGSFLLETAHSGYEALDRLTLKGAELEKELLYEGEDIFDTYADRVTRLEFKPVITAPTESESKPEAKPNTPADPNPAETPEQTPEFSPSLYTRLVRRWQGQNGVYYALHDMDGDGKEELLVMSGTCEADFEWTVYTPSGSGITELGRFTGFHSILFPRAEGGVYCMTGQMMYEVIYVVTVEGHGLNVVTEFEGAVEEYFDPAETYLEIYDINDLSPLT